MKIPLLFLLQNDLSDDLLSLLTDDNLKSIGASTITIPDFKTSSVTVGNFDVQSVEFDHQYCSRPHLKSVSSDSGISNDSTSNGPISPQISEGYSDSVSPTSGMSPRSSAEDPPLNEDMADSPLGGGVEDLQLTDFNFDSLDTSALLTDDDFFSSIVQDSTSDNFTLDLGILLLLNQN